MSDGAAKATSLEGERLRATVAAAYPAFRRGDVGATEAYNVAVDAHRTWYRTLPDDVEQRVAMTLLVAAKTRAIGGLVDDVGMDKIRADVESLPSWNVMRDLRDEGLQGR